MHLKDQAVQPYDKGFLLGDIPLGQGCLPLKEIVQLLRREKPDLHFSLELITRDPLKVPVLEPSYWATFPQLPAQELADMLRFVHDHAQEKMQQVSSLSPDQRVELEQANIQQSLLYAHDQLGL